MFYHPTVDNSAERFGDRVSIADLARNGFRHPCNQGATLSVAKERLEFAWKWELESCVLSPRHVEATFKDGSKLLVRESYERLEEPGEYEPFDAQAGDPPAGKLWWSNAAPPPPVGAKIHVRMNGLGSAVVTGYFRQDSFLGVLCRFDAAPDWLKKQNKGDPTGHVFGAEIQVLEEKA